MLIWLLIIMLEIFLLLGYPIYMYFPLFESILELVSLTPFKESEKQIVRENFTGETCIILKMSLHDF